MKRRRLWLLVVLLASVYLPGVLAAQADSSQRITVSLITFGQGRAVWELFGHNAIWIHDPARGADVAYDYGRFDFAQSGFLLHFLQGRMRYWMGSQDAIGLMTFYTRMDRSIWVQELNLTPAEARRLETFLAWNIQEENKFYRYDYYRDNCSTRIRDALDRALGGEIFRQTHELPAGTTYRSQTGRLTARDPLIYTGLMLLLGQPVDQPLSVWQDMFIPMSLRDHLNRVTVPGPGGSRLPLVRSEERVFVSSLLPPPAAPPRWTGAFLLAGLLAGLVLALLGWRAPHHAGARIGFIGMGTIWALLVGIAGLLMTGLWALTDHAVAARNENLFAWNLLALPLVVLLPRLGWTDTLRAALRRALGVALAVLGLGLLGLAVKLLPGFIQRDGQLLALALPVHLGLVAGLWAWRSRVAPDGGRS